MTLFVAAALLELPGGDWFSNTLAARHEMDAAIKVSTNEAERNQKLRKRLEDLDDITLRTVDGDTVQELLFTFTYYDDATRTLILAVRANDENPGRTHIAVDLDGLFTGQYDPKTQRLYEEDTAYVIATLDESFQPTGQVTVVQTASEEEAYGLNPCETLPPTFLSRLLAATP